MATKKKSAHRSLIYESEQRLIRSGISRLYSCAADRVFLNLQSPEDIQAMEKRALCAVNSHNYMSINNKYVEESFEGIQEKFMINGRHKESMILKSLWEDLVSKERPESNMSEVSVPHAMIKLLLQLSVTPTQPGKHSNVHSMMMMSEDMTSQETGSECENDATSDDGEMEYAAIEEDRKLWMSEFDDLDSDSDFYDTENEFEEKSFEKKSQPFHAQNEVVTGVPVDVQTSRVITEASVVPLHDPFFQTEGGDIPYGGHISLHRHRHAALYPAEGSHTPVSFSSAGERCKYSTSLLCPLPLLSDTFTPQSVICREEDVCVMVIDMLLGNSSDFFLLSADPSSNGMARGTSSFQHPMLTANRTFSLTPTAQHSRLVHVSSQTLNNLLSWFVSFSNQLQAVRNYAMVDFSILRREYCHSDKVSGEDTDHSPSFYHPTGLSERMQTSVQLALRPPLKQLQAQVTTWQHCVLRCNGRYNEDINDDVGEGSESMEDSGQGGTGVVTLIFMHAALRKTWAKVLDLAGQLTRRVISLDFVPFCSLPPATAPSASDIRTSGGAIISGDLIQHELVLALLQQLQDQCDALHLLHCHPQMSLLSPPPSGVSSSAQPSASASQPGVSKGMLESDIGYGNYNYSQFSSTLHLELNLCNNQLENNFLRSAFFSIQAEYLNSLVTWLYSAGGGGGFGIRNVSSSDSELMGGFGGVHMRERTSLLLPLASAREDANTFNSPPLQPLSSIGDIHPPSPPLRLLLHQTIACVLDMRILQKYHLQHQGGSRSNSKITFDTRDFRSSVVKATHAALALYAPVSIGDAKGVVEGGFRAGGSGLVIASPSYRSRSRRRRRGGRGKSRRGCDMVIAGPVKSSNSDRLYSTPISNCSNSNSSGSSIRETQSTGLEDATDHYFRNGGDGSDDSCEHILSSSFSSHKNVMYTYEVLRRNSKFLRRPYIRSPPTPPPGSGCKELHNHDQHPPDPLSTISTSVNVTNAGQANVKDMTGAICLPLLADIFPSTAVLSNLVMLLPLSNTLTCTQRTAVTILQERFHLFQHFSFLQSVFLLGEVSAVFAALREQLFTDSGGISSSGSRLHHQQHHYTNMLRAISDSIMLRITHLLPKNFSESLVSVTFATSPISGDEPAASGSSSASTLTNALPPMNTSTDNIPAASAYGYSQAERLYTSLNNLMVQIHYPPPLSDVLPPPAISTYNAHMQFLLKITLCCWTSESLWKQATGSNSFLTYLCSSRRRHGGSGTSTTPPSPSSATSSTTAITATITSPSRYIAESQASLRRLHRTCMTGLQWIIYISRALESFYLHEIHHVQSVQFKDFLSLLTNATATVGTASNISISTLAESHELYLNRVSSCVNFLQPEVLSAVQASVSALGVFEEAHVAAEANKVLLSAMEEERGGGSGGSFGHHSHSHSTSGGSDLGSANATNMVHKVVCSRLTHAASKMKQAQEGIVSLVDRVEGLHRQQQLNQQGMTAAEVQHMTAMRSLLGHISNSGGID